MQIEMLAIGAVREYERNPRNNDDAVAAVAESIKQFGFKVPVIVDGDGVLVAGHTRVKAAQRLGLTQVPAIRASDLTPEQIKAFRIADNKLHELSTWNLDLLALEVGELQALDIDLAALGFDQDELARLFDPGVTGGLCDPDDVPEPPDEATTQRGDLWLLPRANPGDPPHRLLCGDSANPVDVDRLLAADASRANESADLKARAIAGTTLLPIHLANLDPPYNVKVEPRSNNAIAAGLSSFEHPSEIERRRPSAAGERGKWVTSPERMGGLMKSQQLTQSADVAKAARGRGDGAKSERRPLLHHQSFDVARQGAKKATTKKLRPKDRPLANDFVSDEAFDQMLHAWFGNIARVLLPGRSFYIWGGYANLGNYPPVLKACGLYFSQGIVWDKQHPVLTRKDFMGAFEICFYGWREGAGHSFFGPNNATDVWSVKKVNPQSVIHLTEKPVELAVRAMQYSSRVGEHVLDLFGGSGSTLIAAEQTGRRAFLMELDPLYCDVIVQRFEKFTGRKARRVSTRSNAPVGTEALEARV